MALAYTVNWVEQGRTPSEEEYTETRDVIETAHRVVWINTYSSTGSVIGKMLFRQSRSREGQKTTSGKVVYAEIESKATTVTTTGVTTVMTQSQATEILEDAYTTSGLVSASTGRIGGPAFSVTKTVRASSPLSSSGTTTTEWGTWSDWTPAVPTAPTA